MTIDGGRVGRVLERPRDLLWNRMVHPKVLQPLVVEPIQVERIAAHQSKVCFAMIIDVWGRHVATFRATRQKQDLARADAQEDANTARALVGVIGAAADQLLIDLRAEYGVWT